MEPSRTRGHDPRMHRLSLAAPLAAALLALVPATALSATTTVGSTAGEPKGDCAFWDSYGGAICTVVGPAAPSAGTVRAVRITHGATAADTQVTVAIFSPSGPSRDYTVKSAAPAQSLSSSATTTTTIAVSLAVAAGDRVGFTLSESAPTTKFGVYDSEGSMDVRDGPVAVGSRYDTGWASFTSTSPLAADIDTGTGGGGGSAPGGASGGAAPATQGGRVCRPAGAAARRAAVRDGGVAPSGARARLAEPAVAAAAWRTRWLDRSTSYVDALLLGSRSGFVAFGRTFGTSELRFLSGSTRRPIAPLHISDDYAAALGRGGTPVVAWRTIRTESEDAGPGLVGRAHSCDVVMLAGAPAFTPAVAVAAPEDTGSIGMIDLAGDPATGALHLAYGWGRSDALVYQPVGGAPESLPLSGVGDVRVSTARGRVAVAASAGGSVVVFVRSRAGGPWRRTTIRGVRGPWDMQLGRDGRPRLAFQTSRAEMAVYTGRHVVRTGAPIESVSLALDGADRFHIALTGVAPRRFCFAHKRFDRRGFQITCVGTNLYYVTLDRTARRGRIVTAQRALGQSKPVSIALAGRRVGIALPGRSSWAQLRYR